MNSSDGLPLPTVNTLQVTGTPSDWKVTSVVKCVITCLVPVLFKIEMLSKVFTFQKWGDRAPSQHFHVTMLSVNSVQSCQSAFTCRPVVKVPFYMEPRNTSLWQLWRAIYLHVRGTRGRKKTGIFPDSRLNVTYYTVWLWSTSRTVFGCQVETKISNGESDFLLFKSKYSRYTLTLKEQTAINNSNKLKINTVGHSY